MKTTITPGKGNAFENALHDKLCQRIRQPFNEIMGPVLWKAKGSRPSEMDAGMLASIEGRVCNLISNMILSNVMTIAAGNVALSRQLAQGHLDVLKDMIDQSFALIANGDCDGVTMHRVNTDGSLSPFDFRDHMTGDENRNDSGRGDA